MAQQALIEAQSRRNRIFLFLIPALILIRVVIRLLHAYGIKSSTVLAWSFAVLIVGTLAWMRRETRLRAWRDELERLAIELGLRPFTGLLFGKQTGWPTRGFAILDNSNWSILGAFESTDGAFRLFCAKDAAGNPSAVLGALIHVPSAKYPDIAIAGDRVELSDSRFGEPFKAAWRAMQPCSLEAKADWILLWTVGALTPETIVPFTARVRDLCHSVRLQDAAGTKATQRGQTSSPIG
jgi:hypothetical protein